MAKPYRRALIVLNIVGVLMFTVLWLYSTIIAPMGASGRVTMIDREGIINIEKLTAFDANLASNVRYELADWIAERDRQASKFNAVIGLLICSVNFLLLALGDRPLSLHWIRARTQSTPRFPKRDRSVS